MKTKISLFAVALLILLSFFSVFRILNVTATLQKPGTCFAFKDKMGNLIIKLEGTRFNNWGEHLYDYTVWKGNAFERSRYFDDTIKVERLLERYPNKIECPKEVFGPWPESTYY